MKILFIALLLTSYSLISSCATQPRNKEVIDSGNSYSALSDEKFAEIEAKVFLQENWAPIIIEGYSKSELVTFYIQSYSDEIIDTWADFAYNKMHRFEDVVPTAKQEVEFQKFLELPKSRDNAYKFMMLMTTEQIEAVGY